MHVAEGLRRKHMLNCASKKFERSDGCDDASKWLRGVA